MYQTFFISGKIFIYKGVIVMNNEVFFNDVNDLVKHLYFKFGELTPLKVQKSLYFLFALYAGLYSGEEKEGQQEQGYSMPDYLFDSQFEAWTYGPVIPQVYQHAKYSKYEPEEYEFDSSSVTEIEISKFIDDVGETVIGMSDFALVDRSHEDDTWKEAIDKGNSQPMSNEDIAHEYRELIKQQK